MDEEGLLVRWIDVGALTGRKGLLLRRKKLNDEKRVWRSERGVVDRGGRGV